MQRGSTKKAREAPQPARGGTNARGAGKTQGKRGNGAQKLKQKKKKS